MKNKEYKGFLSFLQEVFDLQHYVDKEKAQEEIKNSINFKGMAAYILIASIMVASIGLNANSVAVVIGAMLISPLMGPILGIGYSIAVNDLETLRRSFINFAIMIVIALLTSFIYFSLIPITNLNDQLKGRIEPTSLDVMIAFFGGFAGIAALSSKSRNANIIAGVAIATALMPPLCTAGYGLAKGLSLIGYKDYTGFTASMNALYLFFINSVFIAVATFLFVKITRFPLAKYQNIKQRRRTNLVILTIVLVTMTPSAFIFYGIVQEEIYQSNVRRFLDDEVKLTYPNTFINIENPSITQTDSINYLSISTISEHIPQQVIQNWNRLLHVKYGLATTDLFVQQGASNKELIAQTGEKFFATMFEKNRQEIQQKDSLIYSLKNRIGRLNSDSIPFQRISKEIKAQYPLLDHFGYAVFDYTNFRRRNSFPVFILSWKKKVKQEAEKTKRIKAYLKARLNIDTLEIVNDKLVGSR